MGINLIDKKPPARAHGEQGSGRAVRNPSQARGQRTRRRIVRAALECFEAHGFEATTTALIAERAEVGVGTVYSYFDNKHHLLLEIVEGAMASLSQTVIEYLDPGQWTAGDPRATTRVLIDLIFHTHNLTPGMQRVVWERYFKDPDVQALCEQIWARTREAIGVFLEEVERAGQLRSIDRESATHVIHNAVQWNAMRAFADGDPERIRAFAAATVDMISRFVFVDPDGGDAGSPPAQD